MLNLIIGYSASSRMETDRMFEHTDDEVKSFACPGGVVNTSRLMSFPTLVMPERQDRDSEQIARLGHVEALTLLGRDWSYRFVPNPEMAPIPTDRIEAVARELEMNKWEFNRTHWAIKQVDPYRILFGTSNDHQLKPSVFRLPTEIPTDPDLVAVMMPFGARFDAVYAALQEAAVGVDMTCLRADELWVNAHIMDDILNLIWRAKVVVADLTERNPNVFYEAGIAHTIGREVIPIAQSLGDIPFDLRSIRSLAYLNNDQGLEDLKRGLIARLQTLRAARAVS